MKSNNITKWQRELKSFLGLKSGIILEGNILDVFFYEKNGESCFENLDELLHSYGDEVDAIVCIHRVQRDNQKEH